MENFMEIINIFFEPFPYLVTVPQLIKMLPSTGKKTNPLAKDMPMSFTWIDAWFNLSSSIFTLPTSKPSIRKYCGSFEFNLCINLNLMAMKIN